MSTEKSSETISEQEKPPDTKELNKGAKPFLDILKVLALIISIVLTAGIAMWISSGGGSSTLFSWFRSATVKATSLQRPSADIFMAGEKLRLSLQNVKSEKVIWIIDERETLVGYAEVDFEFPFNSSQPRGIATDHRIDVFFKDGGGYRVTSTVIRIQNISLDKDSVNQ